MNKSYKSKKSIAKSVKKNQTTTAISEYPKILIKDKYIGVSHTVHMGGKVYGSILTGIEGTLHNYNFSESGNYNIEPGKYIHSVSGLHIGPGMLLSTISYK